jgi:hypothetical protein
MGIVVQNIRQAPGNLRNGVKADTAGFFLGKVHDDVDSAVFSGNVDGNILEVEPAGEDSRFEQRLEPALFRVVDGGR